MTSCAEHTCTHMLDGLWRDLQDPALGCLGGREWAGGRGPGAFYSLPFSPFETWIRRMDYPVQKLN